MNSVYTLIVYTLIQTPTIPSREDIQKMISPENELKRSHSFKNPLKYLKKINIRVLTM